MNDGPSRPVAALCRAGGTPSPADPTQGRLRARADLRRLTVGGFLLAGDGERSEPMTMNVKIVEPVEAAVLDDAHIGHIQGAFGTILHGDVAPRETWKHRLTTLLAIIGPGLIVMAGDNDAGAFGTYGQAGQTYGTTLLWTLALLIPGALRQPGDGAAPRRGHRRRPRAADLRAVRQVLGRLQRHRPLPAQRADHRHRVHRHQPRRSTTSACNKVVGVVVAAGADHRGGEHRRLPPLRALLDGAGVRQPAAGADLS